MMFGMIELLKILIPATIVMTAKRNGLFLFWSKRLDTVRKSTMIK
jgi:hypothetical protein